MMVREWMESGGEGVESGGEYNKKRQRPSLRRRRTVCF